MDFVELKDSELLMKYIILALLCLLSGYSYGYLVGYCDGYDDAKEASCSLYDKILEKWEQTFTQE